MSIFFSSYNFSTDDNCWNWYCYSKFIFSFN